MATKKLATAGSFQLQDIDARFAAKWELAENGCWLWTSTIIVGGYPAFKVKVGPGQYMLKRAHRWAYERYVGPIPERLPVDHVCHTLALQRGECAGGTSCLHRRCVNPGHLEIVTNAENVARSNHNSRQRSARTHCNEGHEFTEKNTYWYKTQRRCRICNASHARKRKADARKARLGGMTNDPETHDLGEGRI